MLDYHVIASPGPDMDAEAIWAESHQAMRDGLLAKSGGRLLESGIAPVDLPLPGGVLAPKGSWFIVLERDTNELRAPVAKAAGDDFDYRGFCAQLEVKAACAAMGAPWWPAASPLSFFPDPMRPASGGLAKAASAVGLTEAEREACARWVRGL